MSISSARPDNLDDFSRQSQQLDGDLQSSLRMLLAAFNAFESANEWGAFDARSLLLACGRHLQGNDFTVRWVAGIAAAFRAAGAGGSIVRLPDAAIKASLKAAGLDHGRQHVTFDKPVAFGSPPTTGYTSDPVNTATGNFVELERDLTCGGLADGLTFERTYNSRSDRVGPLGRGWSSWASVRLVARPDGVEYVGPDGQEAVFPRLGTGYDRVAGVAALVEPLESGLAMRRLDDGGRWVFDDAGLPVSVSRGPGTEIGFSHDAGGRLVELAHGGGRRVNLEWDDGSERIVALRSSDGRRVAYRYDASGNLVVAGSEGGTRSYELDAIGRIVSVVDADGVVELVNTYDADGRVLEQLSPFGRRTRILYLPGRVTVTMDDDESGPINTYIHDAEGRLTAVVDGDQQQVSMTYDEWGNRASMMERNGVVTLQESDRWARPVRHLMPTGAELTRSYDEADRLVELALANGAVTRYSYAGDERIASEVVDPDGAVTRRVVRDGLVHQTIDPDGVTVDFEYDADGSLIATTDADGNTVRVERDDAGRIIASVTPLGARTNYFYDAGGRLVERHDAAGGVWMYEYTPAGRLRSATDPTGGRRETCFGDHGRPTATVDPLAHVTTREYDVFGNVVGVVEPDGATWRYDYDAVMRLVATVDPLGARWERDYDASGMLVAMRAPDGVEARTALDDLGRITGIEDGQSGISFERDEFDRIVAVRRPDGTGKRVEFDLCGRQTLIEDATGAATRLEYTAAGRIARVLYPSGRVDCCEYTASGRLAAIVDKAGRRWELRYDPDGALAERRLPTGEVERVEYDAAGRATQVSVPGEGVTTYEYDPAWRIAGVCDRHNGQRRFEYDLAGHLAAATDANGAMTRFVVDAAGRPIETIDPLGGTFASRYDAGGRLIERIDQLGRSAQLDYNAAGRLVGIADGSGRRVRMSYDGAGLLTSFGPDGGPPTTVEYDALGRIVGMQAPGSPADELSWDAEGRLVGRARGDLAMGWRYDADGERAAVVYPDGSKATYRLDASGYAVAIEHPALGSIELERDPVGRLVGAAGDAMQARWCYRDGDLAEYEMRAGSMLRTAHLTRDPVGRVVQATVDGAGHTYDYDAAGQLVAATTPGGSYTFAYDANGRLERESSPAGSSQYRYDAAGQLLVCSSGEDHVVGFEYDAAGRRVRELGPDVEQRYVWDELGRLSEIRRGAGEQEQRSLRLSTDALGELAAVDGRALMWDSAAPFQPLAWDGEAAVLGDGSPWARAGGAGIGWLAPDWQGTVGDAARDPWGALIGAGAAGIPDVRLGYRGELELGDDTWLRARIYRPQTRSFPQPDPLEASLGTASATNPYHYAANDPIGRSDPLGLHPVTDAELKAYRHKMDRNALEVAADNAGDASAGLTVVGLIVAPFFPPAGLAIAGVGLALSGVATANSAARGKWHEAGISAIGMIPGGAALRLGIKARNLGGIATSYGNAAIARTVAAARARGHGLEGLARQDELRADHLITLAQRTEAARKLVKTHELAANIGDVIVGPGGLALQKLFPPGDDGTPSCEPPRPKPLRIPSLHAR
jgi:RHS repeat-associated protein